jgi:hypothetical protein
MRVRTPTIHPIGNQFYTDSLAVEQLRKKIQQETRHLVHYAQERIKQDKHFILVRKGDFIYTYQLWVIYRNFKDTFRGFCIRANDNLVATPLGPQFYEKLQQSMYRSLFPASRKVEGMKCYELYTIHLELLTIGCFPAKGIETHSLLLTN